MSIATKCRSTRIAAGTAFALLACLPFSVGCGNSGAKIAYPARTVNEPAAAAGAVLSGVVTIAGTVPPPRQITLSDGYCSPRGVKIWDETYVAGDGKLANVLVWVKSGLEAWTFDWDRTVVEFDQLDCVFLPHVLVARAFQPLSFKNSDGTSHNVNTQVSRNTENAFNFSVIPNGGTEKKQFVKTEIGLKVRCDVHPNMLAYLHVIDHPYHAVTDLAGQWSFKRPLPPGSYVFQAWHEKLGAKEATLSVVPGTEPVAPLFGFEIK